MDTESNWAKAADSKFFSIFGALIGSITGSLASGAFGGTAALDMFTKFLILGTGLVLGVLIGGRLSGGLLSNYFSKTAEERFENIASVGIAFLGFAIAMGGSLVGALTIGSESPISGVTSDLVFGISLMILLYVVGFVILFWGLGYLSLNGRSD